MAKPNNPKTRDNFYAALAYDPSKSCHYKIVHFKVLMCSIFLIQRVEIGLLWHVSSKITLLRLAGKNERFILKESYIDYLAQAIWLGFFVDQESFQVQAIELPKFVTPKEIINRLDKEQKVLLSEQPKEDLTRERIGVLRVLCGERVFYFEEPFI